MRICFVAGAFPPDRCGIGDYTEKLGVCLANRGHTVHVITSCNPSVSRHPRLSVWRIMQKWNFLSLHRIFFALRKIAPDVIHLQFPSLAFRKAAAPVLIPLLARLMRACSVVTLHEYGISPGRSRIRQLAMAAAATDVIATNQEDFNRLRKLLPWKARKIRLINIGSNIDPLPEAEQSRTTSRAMIGATDAAPVLSYFGNMHPGKGIENLLDAFRIVQKKLPGSKLLIIGSVESPGGSYASRLRDMLLEMNLARNVHITGYVSPPQVSGYLSASDICVLPYRDGLSTRRGTFLAAMKHHLPVISTLPRFPLPSYMSASDSFVLIPPDDAERLADCVLLLWRSPEYRRKLSRNIAKLDRHFSWKEIARQNLEVYAYEQHS